MTPKKFKNLVFLVCFFASLFLLGANIIYYNPGERINPWFFKIITILAFPLFLKFTFYMTLSPWYKVREALYSLKFSDRKYTPKVSVLIPAWNEEVGIIQTIKSVYDSDYSNLEIIVINDGSTDNTDKLVKDWITLNKGKQRGPEVIYHYQENSGKSGAINRGINISSGEIILTIDADSFMKKDTVRRFVEYFKDPETMCVGGNIIVGNKKSILGTVQALEFLVTFYMKRCESLFNGLYIVGGAAAAYRKEIFQHTGLFNTESITEDIDMSMKIQELGYKIRYAEDAVVVTEGAGTMDGLMKQRLRWKRGRFDTFLRYRKMFFSIRPEHNKFLTLFILPFSLLAELQLLFEFLFLFAVYTYSFITLDFTIPLLGAVISGSIFIIMSIFSLRKPENIIFSVIGWGLFYLATFVEHNALIRTLWSLMKKQTVKWQSWQRQGVLEEE